jgi:hypothetical protein
VEKVTKYTFSKILQEARGTQSESNEDNDGDTEASPKLKVILEVKNTGK